MKKINARSTALAVPLTWAVIALSFGYIPALADSNNAADALINAFTSNCSSWGETLSTALFQATSLEDAIKTMKNDPTCQGYYTTILQDVNAQAAALTAAGATNRKTLPGYVEDLQAEILNEQAKGSAKDTTYIASLEQELYAKKIELFKSKFDTDYQRRQQSMAIAANLYRQSSTIMQGLAANAECVGKYPNIAAQIGGQVMQSSSQFANDLAGSTLLATGGIIDNFVKMYRDYGLAKTLKDITDEKFGVGIGCALEGLSSTYCQARDLMRVANANKLLQEKVAACLPPASPFAGVSLVGRDLNDFVKWVQDLDSGSRATSSTHASLKGAAKSLQSRLSILQDSLDGTIYTTLKDLERTGGYDPRDPGKVNKMIGLIKNLEVTILNNINKIEQGQGYTSQSTGPLGDAFARDTRCGVLTYFYTKGLDRVCPTSTTTEACEECIKKKYFGSKDLIPPTIEQLNGTLENLFAEGLKYVTDQNSLVNSNDPQLALAKVSAWREDGRKVEHFLLNAKNYLESLLKDPDPKSLFKTQSVRALVVQALDHVNKAKERLEHPSTKVVNDKTVLDPKSDVTYLSNLLAPINDVYYLPKEILFIANQDINDKVNRGKIDSGLALLIKSTTTDALNEFTKGYVDIEKTTRQAESAQLVAEKNLKTLWKAFDGPIVERLKYLSKSNSTAAKRNLAMFCAQLTLIPGAPKLELPPTILGSIPIIGILAEKEVDLRKYCKGERYKSKYANANIDLDFDALSKLKFEDRECAIHDYFKKAKLEGLKLKQQPEPPTRAPSTATK